MRRRSFSTNVRSVCLDLDYALLCTAVATPREKKCRHTAVTLCHNTIYPAHRGYEFEFLPPALHHTYQVMPMRSSMRRPRQSAGQEQSVVYAWQRARGKVER